MSVFNKIKAKRPKSSVFDLSHEKKLTLNMGELVPIYMEEVLPNDRIKTNTELLIRFHPLLAPLMHRIDATIHYFYVPWRLVFKNWDKFITGGEDGNDTTVLPFMDLDKNRAWCVPGSLADYLGIPIPETTDFTQIENINALPFRAYQLIFNEYYRDQNLLTKVAITDDDTVSETEEGELITLRKRAWQKDYFTSALPWAQKGGSVLIPIDPTVTYKNECLLHTSNTAETLDDMSNLIVQQSGLPSGTGAIVANLQTSGMTTLSVDNIEAIENATATINDLRTASRVQEWLEKNARAGSRLFESMLVHWGVISDDLRIGRPSYLGGGRIPVTISEVLSTFENSEVDLGQMGGHGISAGNNASFRSTFKEYGVVMGILSISPKPAYQQGLPKIYKRFDKFDYAWPEFANLGEQEIKNRELFMNWNDPTNVINNATWGYTPRYSEYKFGLNTVHGDFRKSLDFWHAGRIFTSLPALSEEFITCDTADIDDRIFPVADAQATDKLYVQLYNNVKAVRCLPYFGTPRL
jgi:hypothetical protein